MVYFKEVTDSHIIVRGRFDCPDRIVKKGWIPIRKKLVEKGVVMIPVYDAASDTTKFNFMVNTVIHDKEVAAGICKKLQKHVDAGGEVTQSEIHSAICPRFAVYVAVFVSSDRVVHASIDAERLSVDLMNESITMFSDWLMQEFDGNTPAEMATDYTLVSINNGLTVCYS
jgi:hypothetical protein